MSYTQILYQLVWSTRQRKKVMIKENRHRLFRHMWGTLKNHKCHLYRINGVEDHLHILTDLHPTVALSDLVKDLKISSSLFIKNTGIFPGFKAWQKTYAAFTYSIEARHNLIEYIKNQEAHHAKVPYVTEVRKLFLEHQIEFDERFLL
jgi:REP element-mobilizing transposase RayT